MSSRSENAPGCPSSKQEFELTFKILEINLEDEENSNYDDLKASVRFAEKCFVIKHCEGTEPRNEAHRESTSSSKSAKLQSTKNECKDKRETTTSRRSGNESDDVATGESVGNSFYSKRQSDHSLPSWRASSTSEGIFGSNTERFECSAHSLSEKLANHCIKYEIQRNGNLIGKSFLLF